MSPLGRFLEISLRTPNILESLDFYRSLGFTELQTGDIYAHKYAVVSDGVLCLGLHETEFDAPSITFVCPDLARRAQRFQDGGFDFSFVHRWETQDNTTEVPSPSKYKTQMTHGRSLISSMPIWNDCAHRAHRFSQMPLKIGTYTPFLFPIEKKPSVVADMPLQPSTTTMTAAPIFL